MNSDDSRNTTGEGRGRELPPSLKGAASAAGPVRPLLPPVWRAALPVALGAAIGLAAIAWLGSRPDAAALGSPTLWGPVLLRVVAGAWLIGMSLREGSPSEGSTGWSRAAAFVVVPLILIGSAEWLARRAGAAGLGDVGRLACYPMSLGFALPVAGAAAWLLARAYPLRPAFAGACAGLGSGLFADAAMHATCPAVDRAHTLLVHGGALVTVALAGAAVAVISCRRRSRA